MDVPTREWTVAGGLVETEAGLLLVQNRRRGGSLDWSPPGGVIDTTDVSVVAGLTREVEEETGLVVFEWEGPVYEVRAVAPDLGWIMHCEVYWAVRFEGALRLEDPDGIVVAAAFVPSTDCADLLLDCPPWVREPLAEWIEHRWNHEAPRGFHFSVRGTEPAELHVERVHRPSGPQLRPTRPHPPPTRPTG